MPFCPSCGHEVGKSARFCYVCGSTVEGKEAGASSQFEARQSLDFPLPPSGVVLKPELNGSDEETQLYVSAGPVIVDERKWKAVVTSRRLLLQREEGLVFAKKHEREITLGPRSTVTLRSEGAILKLYSLDIDGVSLKGRRSDLQNIQRAAQFIQSKNGQA